MMTSPPRSQAPRRNEPPFARDNWICAMAETKLRSRGYHPLRHVRCEVVEGVIVLSGNVPSYYMKQVAQTAVAEIDGKTGVDNRLHVESK